MGFFDDILAERMKTSNLTYQLAFAREEDEYLRFFNLLSRMLELDPQERIKPIQALKHPFFTV